MDNYHRLALINLASLKERGKNGLKMASPHISFDGKHWYLSVGYEVKQEEVELTDESLGIDLGVKELAVVSNQDASKTKFYKNINKSAKVRKLEKKRKRQTTERRQLSSKQKKRPYGRLEINLLFALLFDIIAPGQIYVQKFRLTKKIQSWDFAEHKAKVFVETHAVHPARFRHAV